MLGADATSVMISLPRRAVPRRSTRRQPDATATGDDDRDPSMPELGERGYCSSDEEPEYEPPRTRRRVQPQRRTRVMLWLASLCARRCRATTRAAARSDAALQGESFCVA